MGFLDNDTVVVDAILTKRGRELLSEGHAINPTHYTLSDDGIDYTLWNTNSSSGSAGYDDFLTKLPMIEAVPDDAMSMRYTLFTLPQNTRFLPAVSFNPDGNAGINKWELRNDDTDGIVNVTLQPIITNYGDSRGGPELFDFTFYDMTGLVIDDHGGGTERQVTGNSQQAQESNTPYAIEVIGATHVTVSDVTVVANTTCHVLVKNQSTGALVGADITVIAPS